MSGELYSAIENSDEEKINDLIERAQPSSLTCRNGVGDTPLHLAVDKKLSYDIIKRMVEIEPSSLTCRTDLGYTPLHLAIRRRLSDDIIKELIDEEGKVLYMKCKDIRFASGRKEGQYTGETPYYFAQLLTYDKHDKDKKAYGEHVMALLSDSEWDKRKKLVRKTLGSIGNTLKRVVTTQEKSGGKYSKRKYKKKRKTIRNKTKRKI